MHVKQLLSDPQRVFAVVLDAGDEIASSLDRFARDSGVDGASFTAIGAVSSATLGFFDPGIRDYRKIDTDQQAEVVSYAGDITVAADDETERTVHGHMVLALADGSTMGGHLLVGHVRPTLEVIVTESPAHLRRRHDPETGLALIDLNA